MKALVRSLGFSKLGLSLLGLVVILVPVNGFAVEPSLQIGGEQRELPKLDVPFYIDETPNERESVEKEEKAKTEVAPLPDLDLDLKKETKAEPPMLLAPDMPETSRKTHKPNKQAKTELPSKKIASATAPKPTKPKQSIRKKQPVSVKNQLVTSSNHILPKVLKPKRYWKPLSPFEIQSKKRSRQVVEYYKGWQLNTREHCPWEVLHLIAAYGVESKIAVEGPNGKPVTAVGWLCFNRPCQNKRLLHPTRNGFKTNEGPGLQGHTGQLLCMLSFARVKEDYPMQVGGRDYSVADLIEYEKRTCRPKSELTFKLIGLNHYLEPDAVWYSDNGERWTLKRMMREEMAQPIRGVACGGTHRLEGISLVLKKRERLGLPMDGVYAQAKQFIRDYQRYTFRYQNRDGSFSTNWFKGSGADSDPLKRLRTTGHILEWLIISLPESELRRPEMQWAVHFLSTHMMRGRGEKWDAGPLGHGIHALRLYDQRVYQKIEAQAKATSVARGQKDSAAK